MMSAESVENRVRVIRCESWDAFVSESRKTRYLDVGPGRFKLAPFEMFRGQPNLDWKLSSTLERNLSLQGAVDGGGLDNNFNLREMNGVDWYREECANILARFTRSAHGLPGFDGSSSEVDRWLLGRHHGLLSPYLDWSTSPFVAAFFALQPLAGEYVGFRPVYPTKFNTQVCVWGFRLWDESVLSDEFEVVYPDSLHGSRPRAQQAALSRLFSAKYVDLESYLIAIGKGHYLERYEIFIDSPQPLKDLGRMNVTFQTLFPDLQGAALEANVMDRWYLQVDAMAEIASKGRSSSSAE